MFVFFVKELNQNVKENYTLNSLPCGKTFTNENGTIEFDQEIFTSFDCFLFIEVNDGQNIYLRFDYLNIDNQENHIEIGLFHNPTQHKLFHISG